MLFLQQRRRFVTSWVRISLQSFTGQIIIFTIQQIGQAVENNNDHAPYASFHEVKFFILFVHGSIILLETSRGNVDSLPTDPEKLKLQAVFYCARYQARSNSKGTSWRLLNLLTSLRVPLTSGLWYPRILALNYSMFSTVIMPDA
ncbi:hypothetical protein Tco_0516738 [Tanacetum coccineum]